MIQLVVFTIASEGYGLPITQVQEIIHYARPRTVPAAAPAVAGVINLRSKIIPVCDLGRSIGVGAEAETDDARADRRKIVILETARGAVGLVVDDVDKVLTVADDAVESDPATDAGYVDGIAKVGDQLLVLLSPDDLVATLGLGAPAAA